MNFDRLYIVVATLFVLLAVGFLCRKVKIIDDVASKKLSRLILAVGQPAMLVSSLAGAEYNEENPANDDRKLSHVLIDLFLDIKCFQEMQKKELRSASISEIVKYIDNNLLQFEITVDSLSHEFYVSRRTVHRMFVKEFGIPPLKYITGKKIELAQKMLAENLSVEEVSKQLYFSNAEYFRKVFVSTCGISPQKYKNQMQNKS